MARQNTSPVEFPSTVRPDSNLILTSGRAGDVRPVSYIPVLRGESAAGRVGIDIDLAQMPRPLYNAVTVKAQAWFVPKSSHPRYGSYKEYLAAYHGENLELVNGTRSPEPLHVMRSPSPSGLEDGDMFKTLGIHTKSTGDFHTDLFDAYAQIWNFRAAAHSDKIQRRKYVEEAATVAELDGFAPAFWPSGKFQGVVPDYEQALLVGALDLDVAAGRIPVSGIGLGVDGVFDSGTEPVKESGGAYVDYTKFKDISAGAPSGNTAFLVKEDPDNVGLPAIFAEMAGMTIGTTLADIDKARKTKAYAQYLTTYAGNDVTGFNPDLLLTSDLMMGLTVPEELFQRPWLLDSRTVPFGMEERFSGDKDGLDVSVTEGRARLTLSLNLPQVLSDGVIMITLEVLPERLQDRQLDDWLYKQNGNDYPNALRDVQRAEPVDMVKAGRIDAAHTTPDLLYGYEPMNGVWKRDFSRLGGSFYQPDPATIDIASRGAIWSPRVVDPVFGEDHYLAPENFPHDVFTDTLGSAWEGVIRHDVVLRGKTQFGDALVEDNNAYALATGAGKDTV